MRHIGKVIILMLLVATETFEQATKPSRQLRLNETIERELAGSEVHEYVVALKANEFVQVRVEQKGVDVTVKLYDAGGSRQLAEMDSPNGNQGFETLSWIVETSGNYRFRVSRLEEAENAESGKYTIELTAWNLATAANRQRVKAEQMFLQVVKFRPADKQDIPVLLKQYEKLLPVWQELKDEQMIGLIQSIIGELRKTQNDQEVELNAGSDAPAKAKLVVQTNHAILIQSVAFSRDGKILATGDGVGAIKLWDVETGRQLRTIEGHPGTKIAFGEEPTPAHSKDWLVSLFETINNGGLGQTVHSLVFSPDGKTLASGSSDKTIRIWDFATGKQEKVFTQPIRVWLIAFNADGTKLLSIGEDGSYRYWDVASEKEIEDTPPPLNSFHLPWQSPDGELTVVYSEQEKAIKLVNTSTKKQKLLAGHEAGVRRAVFSPDEKTLASCGWDRTVRLWDVTGGKPPKVLEGHTAFVSSVAFSMDGKLLASVGADLTVKLWEVESGKELKTFRGFGDYVKPLAFGKDDKILLTASDNIMHVWDFEKGRKFGGRPIHEGYVHRVVFSPDNRVFASSDQSALDIMKFSRLGRILRMRKDDMGPADKKLRADNVVRLWNVQSGKLLHSLEGHTEEINDIAFSADGKTLASGSRDSIKLWNVESGKEIATFTVPGSLLVTINADGTRIASFCCGAITVWSVAERKKLRDLQPLSERVDLKWLGFSDDGLTIIGIGEDERVFLWDVETGQIKDTFSYKDGEKRKSLLKLVSELDQKLNPTFSHDLRLAVIGQSGGKLALFERESGKLLAWLIALDEQGWAVVTPDGLFDASAEARKQMHYVVGLEAITLEQMKDLYYVPGLLAKIVKGEHLPKIPLFSASDLFPLAEYQLPQSNQKTFTVKLINRGGGIGHVQVIINDKECGGDARPPNFDPNQPFATLQVDLEKCGLLVPGRQNRIEVVSRNASGSLNSRGSSRGVEIVGLFDKGTKPDPPHLYAIVGGVSDYTGDDLDLSYAAKDAEDFAAALELGANKLFDPDKVHIRLLTSNGTKSSVKFSAADAKSSTATKADFEAAFDEFKNATSSDVFVVYLAGHGVSLNINRSNIQPGGDLYLYLTQEATTTNTSILVVEDVRKAMSISSDELAELIKQNKTLKQVLILDTCAAGAAVNSLIGRRDLPSDHIKAIDRLQNRIGFFVLMGSAADKVSYEASQYSQGLLTYSLLEGMKGFKLRDDQFADVSELFTYAQDSVPRLAKNVGGIQRPIVISPERQRSLVLGERGSFDIGMFTAAEKDRIKLKTPQPLVLRPTLINLKEKYDNLQLTPLLKQALRRANDARENGAGTPFSFVDADEMVDAFKISGLYSIEGNEVHLTMRLIRNNIPFADPVIVNGKLDEKDQLVRQIVTAIRQTNFAK